jgi:hypothetical protein
MIYTVTAEKTSNPTVNKLIFVTIPKPAEVPTQYPVHNKFPCHCYSIQYKKLYGIDNSAIKKINFTPTDNTQ